MSVTFLNSRATVLFTYVPLSCVNNSKAVLKNQDEKYTLHEKAPRPMQMLAVNTPRGIWEGPSWGASPSAENSVRPSGIGLAGPFTEPVVIWVTVKSPHSCRAACDVRSGAGGRPGTGWEAAEA